MTKDQRRNPPAQRTSGCSPAAQQRPCFPAGSLLHSVPPRLVALPFPLAPGFQRGHGCSCGGPAQHNCARGQPADVANRLLGGRRPPVVHSSIAVHTGQACCAGASRQSGGCPSPSSLVLAQPEAVFCTARANLISSHAYHGSRPGLSFRPSWLNIAEGVRRPDFSRHQGGHGTIPMQVPAEGVCGRDLHSSRPS